MTQRLISSIEAIAKMEKPYTVEAKLRQLMLNKSYMLKVMQELKGKDFERCKWTISNINAQIKDLREKPK